MKGEKCFGRYVVANAGISGHGIISNSWLLKNWIYAIGIRPLAIIIYQGINDWHVILNANLSFSDTVQISKNEITHTLKYRSILVNSIYKIFDLLRQDDTNRPISKNNGILLFKATKRTKETGKFVSIFLDSNFMSNISRWGGVKYHRAYIQYFIDTARELFPKTRLIFITQTESICDLTDFPKMLRYKDQPLIRNDLNPVQFGPQDWLSNKGTCFRLGIIKSNYVVVGNNNSGVKVIDYAGKNIESSQESYDDYHKTPDGNRLFVERVFSSVLNSLLTLDK